MLPRALLVALILRSLSLLLPHTFFQPDEFYQALEPAYSSVFGHGFLTWEWQDLPYSVADDHRRTLVSALGRSVYGGRLRSWVWPGLFMLIYRVLDRLGMRDTEWVILLPRVVGILIAASTDYFTVLLATRLRGPGAATGALFLSLTSLFNAHLLPRALSTSPETLLTTAALVFYPNTSYSQQECSTFRQCSGSSVHLDPVAMDRDESKPSQPWTTTSIALAAALATLSVCIRPTMLVFWAFYHLSSCWSVHHRQGLAALASFNIAAILGGLLVFGSATALDYRMTGRLVLPVLTFFHQNVFLNTAAFYGGTGLSYHLVQSLPLLLFPLWYWWAKGFSAAVLPRSLLPLSLARLDITPPMRQMAQAIIFTIAVFSLSPHSEWRFLHPLLPQLLMFALPALQADYWATMVGCFEKPGLTFRQWLRIPKRAFYLILLAPIGPYLYLNAYHGAAQVEVMNKLRRGDYGTVSMVTLLMPCHSTPWASHLGRNISGWFLTCDPPLHSSPDTHHWTQQDLFYDAPVSYIEHVFPYPPMPLGLISEHSATPEMPSHVLLFGDVLDRAENADPATVRQALRARGYREEDHLWNGFDLAQDEEKRRGGVRVWVAASQ